MSTGGEEDESEIQEVENDGKKGEAWMNGRVRWDDEDEDDRVVADEEEEVDDDITLTIAWIAHDISQTIGARHHCVIANSYDGAPR